MKVSDDGGENVWSNVCLRGDDDDRKGCVNWRGVLVGWWCPQREW